MLDKLFGAIYVFSSISFCFLGERCEAQEMFRGL